MDQFKRESFIIRDKNPLEDDYQPAELEEREDQLNTYATTLRPVIQGWQPNNVFLYGVTGVGKTAVTHYILRSLQESAEQYDDVDLDIIELNCNGITSSYQVAVNLLNEIRDPKHPVTTVSLNRDPLSETGYPKKRVFNELIGDLDAIGGTILVILDEIDNIGSDDDILYELPRARSQLGIDAKLGVIGISNDFKFRDNLSPKVKDTLCEEEILFPPYDANELRNILRQRADVALYDGVLSRDVIPLCAAFGAQDSGSARQALRLFRKTVEIAETEALGGGDAMAVERHVRMAEEDIQKEQVVQGMSELTRHGQYVLLTVCSLAARGETPERTKLIYKHYREVASGFDADPLKRRRVHDHLSDLELHGVLRLVDSGGGRGNYNMYELDVSLSSALEALEAELTDAGYVREIAESYGVLD